MGQRRASTRWWLAPHVMDREIAPFTTESGYFPGDTRRMRPLALSVAR